MNSSSSKSVTYPNWVKNRRSRPSEYVRIYEQLRDTSGSVPSHRISALLYTSGLTAQNLSTILSLINTKTGNLSEQDFTLLLSLVALFQKGTPVNDLHSLFKITTPPLPNFSRGIIESSPQIISHQPIKETQFLNYNEISNQPIGVRDEQFQKYQNEPTMNSTEDEFSDFVCSAPIGSRLASHNSTDSDCLFLSKDKVNCLLGEEDKYSALRAFVNVEENKTQHLNNAQTLNVTHNLIATTTQPDGDFGDFQSFENANANSFNSNHTANDIILNLNLNQLQKPNDKITSVNNISLLDDFNEDYLITSTVPQTNLNLNSKFSDISALDFSNMSSPTHRSNPMNLNSPVNLISNSQNVSTSSHPNLLNLSFTNSKLASFSHNNSAKTPPKISTLSDFDILGISFPPPQPKTDDFGEFLSFEHLELSSPPENPSKNEELMSSSVAQNEIFSQNNLEAESKPDYLSDLFGLGTSRRTSVQGNNVTILTPSENFKPFPLKTTLIGSIESDGDFDDYGDFQNSVKVPQKNESYSVNYSFNKNLRVENNFLETISVSSLDLGNYAENSSERKEDKYDIFSKEIEAEKSKFKAEWSKCMLTCIRLIDEGTKTFNSASSSSVIREIISAPKGVSYIINLREVYIVACRIYHSWMKIGADEKLCELHMKLALSWDSFVPFLIGSALEDDINQESVIGEEDLSESESLCGICLIGMSSSSRTRGKKRDDFEIVGELRLSGDIDDEDEDEIEMRLEYGGSLYHLPCANLWINEISPSLPSLTSNIMNLLPTTT